jgi:hypothetical protein
LTKKKKEKREQVIEHIKIFLGLVDQEYFLLSQKLNGYKVRLRKLNNDVPKIAQKRARIKAKIVNALNEYNITSGIELKGFTAQQIMQNPAKSLEKLYKLELKVNSSSDKNSNFISNNNLFLFWLYKKNRIQRRNNIFTKDKK